MGQKGGREAFVSQGFDTWNKKDAFRTHVGGVDSFHNKIGQDVFALLVDGSNDVSKKEHMAIVLRYFDSLGFVKERFIGLVHVKDTSSLTLKNAINEFVSRVKEKTYYENKQEKGCKKACVVVNLKPKEVLDFVKDEGRSLANRQQASEILAYFKSYEFVFYLHIMYDILCLTGTLSKQLQRKDLDILEAASMVRGTMEALQSFRNTWFASILPKYPLFCQTHKIDTLDMEELYIGARNRKTTKTNRFHFEVEIFNTVVDMQLTEYQVRFSETSTQLLEYMSALSPCDSFAQFDKSKLLKLGKLYKYDFDDLDMKDREGRLEIIYHSYIKDERFTSLK
ncbi:hypothetical protein Lser_V15G15612 [Lactuca serriola]